MILMKMYMCTSTNAPYDQTESCYSMTTSLVVAQFNGIQCMVLFWGKLS